MLQTQLADAKTHTSGDNVDGPSFPAEAEGTRYGAPSGPCCCLRLDRARTLGPLEAGATGVE